MNFQSANRSASSQSPKRTSAGDSPAPQRQSLLIEPQNVNELTLFLKTSGVEVTELRLNLSSYIAQESLERLLSAVDALPNLVRLEVEVDGRCAGPIPGPLRLALAGSKACLTLSAATRSLILVNPGLLDNLRQDIWRTGAKRAHARAETLLVEPETLLAKAESLKTEAETLPEAGRLEAEGDVVRLRIKVAELRIEAATMHAEAAALQAFLDLRFETGHHMRHEFFDGLATTPWRC